VGEAVVRGIRASIERSIAVKKEADSVVEVISAEDIGKLPDSSIAEALARLPGLAGQRLDGRQSSVSIRGLGEDFSTATLNGREQVSIGDNRGVEFDIYPSEIMSGVAVYKTPDASMTTQGLGGTIDMQTIRPLSAPQSISLNFNYERNSLGELNPSSDDTGWRGTFSYIDQFADDRLGIALAVAKLHSPSQEERWNAWGYPSDPDSGAFVTGGAKPFVRSSMLDRETFMGVAEFAASDRVRITADALYIDFQDDKTLRGIELPGPVFSTNPYSIETITDGLATSGMWQNVKAQVRNDFERRSAKLTSFSSNVAFELTPAWSATVDFSHSDVNRDIVSLESYASSGRADDPNAAVDDIGFTMTPGRGIRFSPTLDYSDDTLFRLGGGLAWGNGVTVPAEAQDGFVNFPHIDDELNTARISTALEIDAGRVNRVEFGLSYADRDKQKIDNGTFLTLRDFPGTTAIPAEFLLPDTSLDFIGMGSMISYDSYGLWKSGFYTETSENLTVATRSINTWTVNEKVAIAYAKAGFDLDIGARSLGGNFGLQVVQTDQSSDGFAVGLDNGLVVSEPTSGGDKFTDVLPTLNTAFHLSDTQQIRFGAARVLSRSRMDRMNASYGYTFDPSKNAPGATPESSPWSGNGANPTLRP
jgi:iron complex outermembrane receptor protein